MKNKQPKISCIISTYNDAAYVEKKIAELQAQTIFNEAEFIFIETASPGNERELIKTYTEQLPNIRLVCLDERKNLFQAWNMGWGEAKADLVCYSNMDDALHPECLQRVVAKMEADSDLDLCSVLIACQDKTSPGEVDSFAPDRLKKLELARRPGPFTAWRKTLSEKMGMFDESYSIIGDRDFWSRAAEAKVKVAVIRKVLYLYSIAPTQLSVRSDATDEYICSEEKGVPLIWHPVVRKIFSRHRRMYKWFPSFYLT